MAHQRLKRPKCAKTTKLEAAAPRRHSPRGANANSCHSVPLGHLGCRGTSRAHLVTRHSGDITPKAPLSRFYHNIQGQFQIFEKFPQRAVGLSKR